MLRKKRSLLSLLVLPKPVLDRWASRRAGRLAEKLSRAYMRRKLRWTEREKVRALEAAFEETLRAALRNENGWAKAVNILLNVGLYMLIANRDIQSVKIDALTHPSEWSRKVNARVVLLTIYEWDVDKVCGRDLREAMDMIRPPAELRKQVELSLRRFRKIHGKAKKNFSPIRNTTIAHRDGNALAQYRAIKDMDTAEVLSIAGDFFGEVNRFIPLLSLLLLAGNNLDTLMRQYSAYSKTSE